MQGDETLQLIGEFRSITGLTLGKSIAFDVERVPKMVYARKLCEGAAIVDDAADRNTAKADAVIAALAPDETGAGSLADGALIGE